jgi:hypothetical protein
VTFPATPFAHLRQLTDAGGVYEHALGTAVRSEHGYCLDDVARALVVVSREPDPGCSHRDLAEQYLAFVLAAQAPDGRFRNRRGTDLGWRDMPSVEDCWGRGLWGLGAALAGGQAPELRATTLAAFDRGARWRSPWSRAMAFAGLGAAEVLRRFPDHLAARDLLAAAAACIGPPAYADPAWPWPEPRLTYANAVVPEVLLAAGAALDRPDLLRDGLFLLGWLLDQQTRDGHLSVVPVGGRGPAEVPARFDQQPIEVAALADACVRAGALTGDARWRDGVQLAAGWFLGANDSATSLYDALSGGGCDGLEHDGRNENQGAESTLALMSTLQHARALALTAP